MLGKQFEISQNVKYGVVLTWKFYSSYLLKINKSTCLHKDLGIAVHTSTIIDYCEIKVETT